MRRDYRLFLKDIIDACGHIRAFVQGMDEDAFVLDEKTCSAVVQKFEVIGEVTKNVPQFVREQYPHIPWKDMAGMRDRLIHGYFGIDYSLVWETVEQDIPLLESQMKAILTDMEQEGQNGQ